MKVTLKVTDITEEDVASFLSTALTGNWAFGINWNPDDIPEDSNWETIEDACAAIIMADKDVTIYETEDESKTYSLNKIALLEAFNNPKCREQTMRFYNQEDDLLDCDYILQVAIFGTQVYS